MSHPPIINLVAGLDDRQVPAAARLYDQAFGQKFRVAIADTEARIKLFESTFVSQFAIAAADGGDLVGLAGFQTPDGSLTGGIGASQLIAQLGVIRGLRAIAVFSLFERKAKPGELVMDGIAVQKEYRGLGIGGRLLESIVEYATTHGYDTVRLDVIDTNANAQRLYERKGFTAVRTEKFGYLRWLLGFSAATTMEFRIAGAAK